MPTALVLGGNGQIGVAAAQALGGDGWQVRVLHRGTRPAGGLPRGRPCAAVLVASSATGR